jgi:ubiquinone/menaquinone biosynthesis C-methylase UbiE
MRRQTEQLGAEPGTPEHATAYALEQFNSRMRYGLGFSPWDLDVLEVGCGHGGICCALAAAGARSVVGVDLNVDHLEFARRVAERVGSRLGGSGRLPIEYMEMDAYALRFPENSFDLVYIDNAFEHFVDPGAVLRQVFRVLRPGGTLFVPVFSSILSKYGLHLKHGLKLPWANLLFSERTIIRAMHRLAADDPKIYELYPGLRSNPTRVADLRRYKDLNDLTYKKFRQLAEAAGFEISWLRPCYTRTGHLLRLFPMLRNSILADILSKGAAASLRKPGAIAEKQAVSTTCEPAVS